MIALDIETTGRALEPWRVAEGSAQITAICAGTDAKQTLVTGVGELVIPDKTVVAWNAVFDVAFLHAAGYDVRQHVWLDAMLITKWATNSLDDREFSLAACAEQYLTDWKHQKAFLKLKEQGDGDAKYWELRCRMDVVATWLLFRRMFATLTPHQVKGVMLEAGNIVPNAIAWVAGLPTNQEFYDAPIPELSREMAEIECRLGLSNAQGGCAEAAYGGKGWLPSKVLRSPKQLADVIYNKWRIPLRERTEKGEPSTSKAALTYMADEDDRALEILAWRERNTLLTKFCQSPGKARTYLGSSTLHPAPKIFGTYTGRYTYGSKIRYKTGELKGEHMTSMALHQTPRGPRVRRMVEMPNDEWLVEFDASNQEIRLIAEIGNIDTMLDCFRRNLKFHALTASAIGAIGYEEFMERYKARDPEIVDPDGLYNCGKFVGLAMNYRIGAKTARVRARMQYDIQRDVEAVQMWQTIYHQTHPGLRRYWRAAIEKALATGYAETLAGRRVYLDGWGDDQKRWSLEQTAINFPIQGTGGDMKNLAITTLDKKFPEARFAWDLHDGIYYRLKADTHTDKLIAEMRYTLDELDYEKAWGWKPRIPMPWEAKKGRNWGEMEEVK